MNDIVEQERPIYQKIVYGAEKHFGTLAESTGVEFQKEALHAITACQKNDYLAYVASENPDSMKSAIYSVATVGLSLNPATAYAYLVPRSRTIKVGNKYVKLKEICLDISYRGFIKIATDTGSILWAQADVVYESDSFIYKGKAEKPEHQADPFSKERGEPKGVYCIAKTKEGDYLVETMSLEEIEKIRSKSESAFNKDGKPNQYSPWTQYWGEMARKAVLKRASKTWPKTDKNERLDEAISIVNEHQGIDFREYTPEQFSYYLATIKGDGMPLDHYCFIKSLEYETIAGIGSAHRRNMDHGDKQREIERVNAIYNEGQSMLSQMAIDINESDDEFFIMEQIESLPDGGWELIQHELNAPAMAKIEQIKAAA